MLPSTAMTTAMKATNSSVIQMGLTTHSHGQSMTPHKRSAMNSSVSASAKPRPTLVSVFFSLLYSFIP